MVKQTIGILLITTFFVLSFADPVFAGRSLVINEIMASNNVTISDEDGDFEDWIELYNAGSMPISLSGYGLTDREGDFYRWVFPDTSIAPGAYLIVWASGKNRRIPGRPLHAGFRIDSEGEPLRLTDFNGQLVDTVPPVILPTDISYGRMPDGSDSWAYFTNPTPGRPNATDGYLHLLEPPVFSHEAGFYDQPFDLVLSVPDAPPGVQIYYTTDGSTPGPDQGRRYERPLRIENRTSEPNRLSSIRTNNIGEDDPLNDGWKPPIGQVFKGTVVRAAAWAPDSKTASVATRTYYVGEQLHDRYQLPVVSLATDEGHFFSEETGIYVPDNFWGRGSDWERPVHFELFETNGERVLAQDAGVRIHGGTSRARPVKSLRLYARRSYGNSWFEYPIIPDTPVQRYKRFIMRNSGNDWDRSYFRDALMQRLVEHTSVETQYYRPVVAFVNGEYWGIHNIRMRYDHRYFESMYDIERQDLVLLEKDAGLKEGNSADRHSYQQLVDLADSPDIQNPVIWNTITERMDIPNFRDYQIANIYYRNTDWPGNNIEFWKKRTASNGVNSLPGHDGRWRWLLFDTDFGFNLDYGYVTGHREGVRHNTLRFAIEGASVSWPNPDWSVRLLRGLLRNVAFRNDFINRFADLLNSAFSEERVLEEINGMYDTLKPHMPEHIRRWRGPETMEDWEKDVESMRAFARERPEIQRSHIISWFNLPGSVSVTLDVNDRDGGHLSIHSLHIKPDEVGISGNPYPWTGTYFKDIPVFVEAHASEGYTFTGWEGRPQAQNPLRIRTFDDAVSVRALFKAVDVSSETQKEEPARPVTFRIHNVRPNPFNSHAAMNIDLPETGPLRVTVFSVDGRKVAVVHDEVTSHGFHTVTLDASSWASGVYIAVAETGGKRASIPLTLVK